MLYATSMLGPYRNHMIGLPDVWRFRVAVKPAVAVFLVGAGLAGCAGMDDGLSSAFVDPAKYEQFDCKQLEAERKALSIRAAELQGLIAKADTGTGGAVIAELAYRNDYVSNRASINLANEVWRRDRCAQGGPASTNPGAVPDIPGTPNSGPVGPSRSGIY
jgi:hypothetical protein